MTISPSIIILGNGPIDVDIAEQVDSCERVVRFNFCASMPEKLGAKCTDLWLTGRGRQAAKLLTAPINPKLLNVKNVMITDPEPSPISQSFFKLIHRQGKIDHGGLLQQKYSPVEQSLRLSSEFRNSLLSRLLLLGKPSCKPRCASSGLLAIEYFLQQYPTVHIAGFGFKGWKRHPWQQEKQYISNLIAQGKVVPLVESSVLASRAS